MGPGGGIKPEARRGFKQEFDAERGAWSGSQELPAGFTRTVAGTKLRSAAAADGDVRGPDSGRPRPQPVRAERGSHNMTFLEQAENILKSGVAVCLNRCSPRSFGRVEQNGGCDGGGDNHHEN